MGLILQQGYPEDGTGGGGDFVAVGDAGTEEGGDVLLLGKFRGPGVDCDYSGLFVEGSVFKVSEEVADLLLALHAQRNHPVARAPLAQHERELEFGGIQDNSAFGLSQRHVRGPWKSLHYDASAVHMIGSGDSHWGEDFSTPFGRSK